MIFQPEIETMPLPKLRALQTQKLKNLVAYLNARSPFYQEKFKEKNITPESIKSMEDIRLLPITTKLDLRDNYPFGMLCVPKNQLIRIHCSSGTTGKPVVVCYTKNDLDIFSNVVARSLAAAGSTPGMLLQNAYGYGLFTGGLGLHYGAERLGMNCLPMSGGMTERQVMLIEDFQPDVMCGTPSYFLTIADAFEKLGVTADEISLKYIIFGAEPWTETIRQNIERRMGVQVSNIYGLSEIIGPGVSQEDVNEKGGSYVWEDHFYPEILDPITQEPLPEGKEGILVFTTLDKEANPFLRYWTNDITYLFYDKQGSRTHVKMGPILGRADDMLIVRGVNVYPTQIEAAVKDIKGILPNYYLLPHEHEHMVTHLTLEIELSHEEITRNHIPVNEHLELEGEKAEYIAGVVQKKIKDSVGTTVIVRLFQQDTLPKNEGGKINRIKKQK